MTATPRTSLVARIFSLEGLMVAAGLVLLGYGLASGTAIALFWGVMALAGQLALHFVRKKDWQAHWAELERQQQGRQPEPPRPEPPAATTPSDGDRP